MVKLVVTQLLIFLIGAGLIALYNNNGAYDEDKLWVYYIGVVLCMIGLLYPYIAAGVYHLTELIKKMRKK